MKLDIILFSGMLLYIFWLIAKDELPPVLGLTAVAVLGFDPYLREFNNYVLSDIPFLFFTYLCLFLITRYYESPRTRQQSVRWPLLVGACIYLACGTRTVGVVLLPVLLLHDWTRQRKLGVISMVATAVCVPLIGLQAILLGASGSYMHMFLFRPHIVWANGVAYAKDVSLLWINGYNKWLRAALFFGMYALAIAGFLKKVLRRHLTVYELFLVAYLGVILLWPYYQGLRFLIPVLPIYLLYAFCTLNDIGRFPWAGLERSVMPALVALILASYVGAYSKTRYGPLPIGVETPKSEALFNFITRNTPTAAVFVFKKPRPLSLYTGRSTSVYPATSDDSVFWAYFRKIRASFLVTYPFDDAPFPRFVAKYRKDLQRVNSNNGFSVYKIVHWPPPPN